MFAEWICGHCHYLNKEMSANRLRTKVMAWITHLAGGASKVDQGDVALVVDAVVCINVRPLIFTRHSLPSSRPWQQLL